MSPVRTLALTFEPVGVFLAGKLRLRPGDRVSNPGLYHLARRAPDRPDSRMVAGLKAISLARKPPQDKYRPGDITGRLRPDSPRRIWRLPVLYLMAWMLALATHEQGAAEATDWMKPPGFAGN